MDNILEKMGLRFYERCIGCDRHVSEIKCFWKYVTTEFGLKPLCIECAMKKGISLI
jgi:hypothetical protein